jgi:hypothetical protein
VYNGAMPTSSHDDWSPADHPYAIAVSEAQWWLSAVRLAAARLEDAVDPRSSPVGSHQVDARNLVLVLAQLLNAERLEQVALAELNIDPDVGHSLAGARTKFLNALPGICQMRNALTHFDEWSQGTGRGEQRTSVKTGENRRDVARRFWGFAYDRGTGAITHGPHRIEVEIAVRAASELAHEIYEAARQVDLLANLTTQPASPPAAD